MICFKRLLLLLLIQLTNANFINSIMVLPDTEKLEFVRKSVSWIQGHDIMDTCFILNFGYEAPLPWPQVRSHVYIKDLSADLKIFDIRL